MATTRKRNVLIDFLIDDTGVRSKLKGIGAEASTTQGRFSQLSGGAKALLGGFTALVGSQVVGFLANAAQAALEDQAAQKQLALALKNTVGATDAQIASTEEWIDRTARATGVADDQLRPALAELVRTHGSLEDAEEAMGVAMDIAAAKGLDLETVTKALGKAALGNVGALGRLGIATRDAKGEMMDYDEVLQEAARTMGGAVTEAAKTQEGQVRRAKVAWDEFWEAQGESIITEGVKFFQTFGLMEEGLYGVEAAVDATTTALDKARHPQRVFTQNQEDMAAAADETADAIKAVADEQRAAADPAFNVLKTQRDLNKAVLEYNTALAEHGPKSQEAIDAALRLAEAQSDASVAAETFAKVGGAQSIQAFEDMLREAGLAEEQIRMIIQAIKDLNKTPVNNPIRVDRNGDVISRVGPRAAGGPVSAGGTYLVGEKGPELLQMGNSGGNIVPNHALGGGGSTYNITVNALSAGADVGQKVVDAIKAYEKRNGARWRS